MTSGSVTFVCIMLLCGVTTNAFMVMRPPPSTTISRIGHHTASLLQMVAVDTSDIKNGMTIELDGEPCKVLGFSIMKQARGAAKTTIKFKNLIRGTTIENTYRSGEKFETALIEKMDAQFTFQEGVRTYIHIHLLRMVISCICPFTKHEYVIV